MSLGRENRSIEVQRQPSEVLRFEAIQDESTHDPAYVRNARGVHVCQDPADCGDIRKAPESQNPADEGIVQTVVKVPQAQETEEKVNDQQEDGRRVPADRMTFQMGEACTELVFEFQAPKKTPELRPGRHTTSDFSNLEP